MIKLIRPTLDNADDIMAYRREFLEYTDHIDGGSSLEDFDNAADWIAHVDEFSRAETCPEGIVHADTLLAVNEDNRVVGVIDCRHHINHPRLSEFSGHIGYSVRPSERRKGYAKEMLRQALEIYCAMGVDRVLITCEQSNIGSERTILANGGVFERETLDGERIMKRFWINLQF